MPRPVGSVGQRKATAELDRESKISEAVDLANKGVQYCGVSKPGDTFEVPVSSPQTLKTGGRCPRRLATLGSGQKKGLFGCVSLLRHVSLSG